MTNTTILTVEELNILYIVKGDSRNETIDNFFDMLPDIDDEDVKKIAESALEKLQDMSDDDFSGIDFEDDVSDNLE
jgi:hypothetical protein